jgi:hypothetical protein
MTWKRRGGRKVIIAPDGGDAWPPAKPRPDETLIRALARAHRWKRLLEEGTHKSSAELAEAEKVSRCYVNRIVQITLLPPDIVEAILDGRQLDDLTRPLPSDWEEQRKRLLPPGAASAPGTAAQIAICGLGAVRTADRRRVR